MEWQAVSPSKHGENMPKTPEKSPPDILEILRKMGDDYICKPRNMKGKELIKHAGLIWAANYLDPNWESECELVYFCLLYTSPSPRDRG